MSGFGRLLVIITGTGIVALSCSFVRFPVTALGVSSSIFKAGALLLLEYSLGYDGEVKDNIPLSPRTPVPASPLITNGLTLKPRLSFGNHWPNDLRVARDLAGIISILCFILSASFESLKRYEMVYRPQEGPLDVKAAELPPVKTLYNNWDVRQDVLGVLFEAVRSALMLLLVSTAALSTISLHFKLGAFRLRFAYFTIVEYLFAPRDASSFNLAAQFTILYLHHLCGSLRRSFSSVCPAACHLLKQIYFMRTYHNPHVKYNVDHNVNHITYI